MKLIFNALFFMLTQVSFGIGNYSTVIKIDHFGYRPADPKAAIAVQNPGSTAEIRNSQTDVVVHTINTITTEPKDADSGDDIWLMDFSSFAAPGSYYVYIPSLNVRSYTFEIKDRVYNSAAVVVMKSFYFQRCNVAKVSPYAGPWQDAICHSTDFNVSNHKGGGIAGHGNVPAQPNYGNLDLRGGWHDAGDYQKTPGWGRGMEKMLWAYELNPAKWFDGQLNIPESGNGIPDILDELKWELDFYVRMQRPDGHFLTTCAGTGGSTYHPPSSSDETRGYTDEWPAFATGMAVMNIAHASIVFKSIGQTTFANAYEQVAANGWNWLNGQTLTGGDNDQKACAAAAVYRMNGTITSAKNFADNFGNWTSGGPANYDRLPWGAYHYLAITGANATVKNTIRTSIGNNVVNTIFGAKDVYGGLRGDPGNPWDWHWGSNQNQTAYGANLMMAHYFSIYGNQTATAVKNQAQLYLHYIHGRNSLNMLYLSNMAAYGGEHSSFQVYHSWFGELDPNFDGKPTAVTEPLYPYYPGDNKTSPTGPAPGLLVGGPNAQYSGTYAPPQMSPKIPARMYRDNSIGCDWDGTKCKAVMWEITEPMCNYTGPYILLISFFAGDTTAGTPAPADSSCNVKSPVVVDGNREASWNQAVIYNVNTVISGTVSSAADLSADYRVMWDTAALYVYTSVKDESKKDDSANPWDDDGIEIYIDGNNNKAAAYDTDDFQFVFRWNNNTIQTYKSGNLVTTPAGVSFAQKDTADGYKMEIRFSWTALGVTPAVGKKIGLDLMVNDDDDGAGRDGKKSWNATVDDAWQNPGSFGLMQLSASTCVDLLSSVQPVTHLQGLYIFPNPATESLTIQTDGVEGISMIRITNLLGETLFTEITEGTPYSKKVDVHHLPGGMYFLEVKTNAERTVRKFLKE